MVNPCSPKLHGNLMYSGDRGYSIQYTVDASIARYDVGRSISVCASTIVWPSCARLMLFLQHIYRIGSLCLGAKKLMSGLTTSRYDYGEGV